MFGKGVLKGLGITLKNMFASVAADRRRGIGTRYLAGGKEQQGPVPGFITVQYPEEKLTVPENFRFYPVLIKDDVTGADWCTACGICARVCPPQCIWIVRAKKPDGKPEPVPAEFYIDTTICMQCGYCAEYCPFDAIKMDHRFEISTPERSVSWVHDKERLTVFNSYYAQTHPRTAALEKAARDEKEAKKAKGGRAAKAEQSVSKETPRTERTEQPASQGTPRRESPAVPTPREDHEDGRTS